MKDRQSLIKCAEKHGGNCQYNKRDTYIYFWCNRQNANPIAAMQWGLFVTAMGSHPNGIIQFLLA